MEEEITEETLERVLDAKLRIGNVRVVGSQRTRPGFLKWVLSQSEGRNTFGSVLEQLTASIEALKTTDSFDAVEAFLDESEQAGETDVVFTVKEKPRTSLTIGTQTGGTIEDTTVSGVVVVRNLFGRLERLRASVGGSPSTAISAAHTQVGSRNYSEFELDKPFALGLDTSLGFRGFLTEENYSYIVNRRGGEVLLKVPMGSLAYESTWREVGLAPDSAGSKVREECGHTFKSALRLSTGLDLRDNPVTPNIGISAQANAELAGVFGIGDVRHFRQDYEAQVHWPFADGSIILNTCARAGMIHRLWQDSPVQMIDKFFLGGPGSLRGFRRRGAGPHDGRDPLGSELFASLFVGLCTPLGTDGLLRALDVKAQAWLNVGSACGLQEFKERVLKPLRWNDSTRAAVGIGLAAALPFGRLEANWCHVLRSVHGDRPRSGLQLGLTQCFG